MVTEDFICEINNWIQEENIPVPDDNIKQPIKTPTPKDISITDKQWNNIKIFFDEKNDSFGKIQWKIVENYQNNPNKHSCQCKQWKQELFVYAIKQGYSE